MIVKEKMKKKIKEINIPNKIICTYPLGNKSTESGQHLMETWITGQAL